MAFRQALLRTNAAFLMAAGTGGFLSDVRGIFFAQGPVASIVAAAPHSGLGFIEAHGLAIIMGIVMWRAEPSRAWHLTAVAIHVLLGTANLVFWQLFVASEMLAVGYVTTALHGVFVALQLFAASTATATAGHART